MHVLKSRLLPSLICCLAVIAAGQCFAADTTTAAAPAVNRVRFLPAPKFEQTVVGGRITGSNRGPDDGYEVLTEIKAAPTAGEWGEVSFANAKPFRWIRYEAPAGSFGRISKLEFYAGDKKLTGQVIGSPYETGLWRPVFSDMPNLGVAGKKADGQTIGLDLSDIAATARPSINPASGPFTKPVTVKLETKTPGAAIRYTTDGTPPTATSGQVYSSPLAIEKNTTLRAIAFSETLAPSTDADAVLLFEPVVRRTTLHFGNSLTANAISLLPQHLQTAGVLHETKSYLMGGGITRTLWNTAMIGPGDPKDEARWKDLFTTAKSMGGVATYNQATVENTHKAWHEQCRGCKTSAM